MIALISGLIPFILTLSRSAILGAGVLVILLFILIIIPITKKLTLSQTFKKKILIFLVSSASVLVLFLAIGSLIPLKYKGNTTSLSKQVISYSIGLVNPEQKSTKGHAQLFSDAVKIGNKHSVFGGGLGTYTELYQKHIDADSGEISPHSTYALLYAEQGLLGLITYLIIFFYIWKITIDQARRLQKRFIKETLLSKRPSKDDFYFWWSQFLILMMAFAIPFFTIATITYYGFFLPMVWWWGNKELL